MSVVATEAENIRKEQRIGHHHRTIGIRGWYTIVALTLFYTLSFVDRTLLSMVIMPLKKDLDISDLQVSLLLGLAFVLLFGMSSVYAGYLVDRVNRTRILGVALVCWSIMQILCGLAQNFFSLFTARMLLGVAESAVSPAAYSIVKDAIPPQKRGIALSVYAIGAPVGGGLALLIAAGLLGWAANPSFHQVPILGAFQPWQVVLIVPGIAGITLAVLLLGLREPVRNKDESHEGMVQYRDAFGFIRQNLKLYAPLCLSFTLVSLAVGGLVSWMPEAVGRAWEMTRPDVGKVLGPLTIATNVLGLVALGFLIDRLSRQGVREAASLVGGLAILLAGLLLVVIPFLEDRALAVGAYGLQYFFLCVFNPACIGTLVQITPSRLIGKVAALNNLVATTLGLAAGPTLVSIIANFFDGPYALANALFATCGTASLVAAASLIYLSRQIKLQAIDNI